MSQTEELRRILTKMGVKWRDCSDWPVIRTCYMGDYGMVAAICGPRTYGGCAGLLEAWNPGENHRGWLFAEEVPELFPPKGAACTRV